MDYADIYAIAMEYFAPKRAALADVLAERLTRNVAFANHWPVTLVDAGAGDGTMIADTLARIPVPHREQLNLICLEPDKSNFRELHHNFNRLCDLTPSVRVSNTALEDYLNLEPGKADILTMTHMLYHVPRDEWAPFLADTFRAAARGARAYITLVNAESDNYRLAARDQEQSRGQSEPGGDYIFAHHLEPVLAMTPGIGPAEKILSTGTYAIPPADIAAFCDAPDARALARTKIAAFLGFVLRQTAEDIARDSGLVARFRDHFRQGRPLQSTETVFQVQKYN